MFTLYLPPISLISLMRVDVGSVSNLCHLRDVLYSYCQLTSQDGHILYYQVESIFL